MVFARTRSTPGNYAINMNQKTILDPNTFFKLLGEISPPNAKVFASGKITFTNTQEQYFILGVKKNLVKFLKTVMDSIPEYSSYNLSEQANGDFVLYGNSNESQFRIRIRLLTKLGDSRFKQLMASQTPKLSPEAITRRMNDKKYTIPVRVVGNHYDSLMKSMQNFMSIAMDMGERAIDKERKEALNVL